MATLLFYLRHVAIDYYSLKGEVSSEGVCTVWTPSGYFR